MPSFGDVSNNLKPQRGGTGEGRGKGRGNGAAQGSKANTEAVNTGQDTTPQRSTIRTTITPSTEAFKAPTYPKHQTPLYPSPLPPPHYPVSLPLLTAPSPSFPNPPPAAPFPFSSAPPPRPPLPPLPLFSPSLPALSSLAHINAGIPAAVLEKASSRGGIAPSPQGGCASLPSSTRHLYLNMHCTPRQLVCSPKYDSPTQSHTMASGKNVRAGRSLGGCCVWYRLRGGGGVVDIHAWP